MIIQPVKACDEFADAPAAADLYSMSDNAIFRAGSVSGIRWENDQRAFPANFLAIPNALLLVDEQHVIFMTEDLRFLPQLYPKPWVYARHRMPKSDALSLDIDIGAARTLAGTVFVPFSVAGNWFHMLFDNYARLFYLDQLPADAPMTIALPHWAYPRSSIINEQTIIHSAFLDKPALRLETGVYRIERLITPPLGNIDDYLFAEPTRFVSERLRGALGRRRHTHPLRIFVSRADIPVRNLANEAELAAELQQLGFAILCPGDYSFLAQLELFSAAEIIVGIHGQGLVPMITAGNCRAILEFEAANWTFTAYRSIASVLGIPYFKLPCELLERRNPARFDWLARADIPACLELIKRLL